MGICKGCNAMFVATSCINFALVAAQSNHTSIRIYLGNGCFFARQYLFIQEFEQKILGRKNDQLTAIVGYAGSKRTGPKGSACYHNSKNYSDYGALGHAEVVEIDVPFESLYQAFATFFGSFVEISEGKWVRPDFYDQGPEYRSMVGVPGGSANAQVLEALRRANVHNMTLQPGHGSDLDTFSTNTVLVMDSAQFPFIQGELCLQFHDDSQVKYPPPYHELVQDLKSNGRLAPTNCPANYICNSTVDAASEAINMVI